MLLAEQPPTLAPDGAVIHQQIAERAYQIFLERAGSEGDAQRDWLQAENEVISALLESSSDEAQFQRACDEIGERAVDKPGLNERGSRRIRQSSHHASRGKAKTSG